ncbi:MAG: 3-deoxy-manno-octulosonate cytidylyltransferase, partial [Burkholderiales bacterium]
ILTAEGHNSGTDRITEVVQLLNLTEDEIIINVQGDEPLIDPQLIDQLAEFIQREQTEVATLAHPIQSEEEIFNPNIVKVVLDKLQHAMYFSRAPIPFYRDGFSSRSEFKLPESLNLLRHIGMYAYTTRFLKSYTQMPTCPLEQVESLEQLRALYNGYKIAVLTTNLIPHGGVDTIEDLDRVRQVLINS